MGNSYAGCASGLTFFVDLRSTTIIHTIFVNASASLTGGRYA